MALSRPRSRTEATSVTIEKLTEYKPKRTAPRERWIRRLFPYLKMKPTTLPRPTTAALLAAPEISDCISGDDCPCFFAISFSTIIGIVLSISNSGSSISTSADLTFKDRCGGTSCSASHCSSPISGASRCVRNPFSAGTFNVASSSRNSTSGRSRSRCSCFCGRFRGICSSWLLMRYFSALCLYNHLHCVNRTAFASIITLKRRGGPCLSRLGEETPPAQRHTPCGEAVLMGRLATPPRGLRFVGKVGLVDDSGLHIL